MARTPSQANSYTDTEETTLVASLESRIDAELEKEFKTGGRVSIYIGFPNKHVLKAVVSLYETAGWTVRQDFDQIDGYTLTFTEA
jgi:hypothetical protein